MIMALKRKKLDAICAHLKKTSAVEVDTTTQNGVLVVGGQRDEDAAVSVAAAATTTTTKDSIVGDAAVAEVGSADDKPTSITTNNNEKTVTDLNENPELASSSSSPSPSAATTQARDPSSNNNNNEKDYDSPAKPRLQTGEDPSSPAVPSSAKSAEEEESSPSSPVVAGDGNDNSISAIEPDTSSIPVSASEVSKSSSDEPRAAASTDPTPAAAVASVAPASSSDPVPVSGAGRRKRRKAAKPRSVFFQPVENLELEGARGADGNAAEHFDGAHSSFLFADVVGEDREDDGVANDSSDEPPVVVGDSLSGGRGSGGSGGDGRRSPVSNNNNNHFAGQYSLQQQSKRKQLPRQHKHQQQRLSERVPNFLYPAPSSSPTPVEDRASTPSPVSAVGGFAPLDLSTSTKVSDANPESLSAAEPFLFNHDNDDDNANDDDDDAVSAVIADSPVSSPSTAASSSPTPFNQQQQQLQQPSPMVVNAEAKVLADYAKNTMNELLSIYGFGSPSGGVDGPVDKQLAQKQLENLSSLRALAAASTRGSSASTLAPSKAVLIPSAEASLSLVPVPPPAHSGNVGVGGRNAVKLPNNSGTNRHSAVTDAGGNLSSSDGLSSSGSSSLGHISPNNSSQLKKPGGPTKYKFHNVKPPKEHMGGGGATTAATGSFPKVSSADYNKYIKKFHSGAACGGSHCLDLGYRDHYHCHDCNFKVFIKKEEMVRHYKWHKKRDESLQHGFLRYSPMDDCGIKYSNCAHNNRQTHYHCIQPGCDKVYISTSDVQMHANYHRKDSAIIQEGFQRFRATEDCGTTTCGFYGQRTTHFHCRRSNCNFTFKNKADMEKHKSYHQKDEILGRDGFKKFMKYEHCSFQSCRFSKVSNHIHCIRPGCSYVLHSTAQLYSHKRKHERREFENLYRTFRQAQRPQLQPASATSVPQINPQLQPQTQTRPMAPSVAGAPPASPVVSIGASKVTSLPLYGEPMVSPTLVPAQILQQIPIKLGAAGIPAGSSPAVASKVSSASAGTSTKASSMIQAATLALSQPLSFTKSASGAGQGTSDASTLAQDIDEPPSPPVRIKQEPQSDAEEESDAESSTTSLSLNTPAGSASSSSTALPCSLDKVKSEELNDSLNLSIPGGHKVGKMEVEELSKHMLLKSLGESASAGGVSADGIGTSSNGKSGHLTMTLLPPMKKQGAPEKRERDETWKNYLIRYTANDPCHSRCLLLYKDHYHCKIPGCQVLFRSKDGVREHAKFHDLQDRITPMVYNKYTSATACASSTCQYSHKQAHYHCNWTGCSHAIPEAGQTFARLEHYRIHEYAKAAAGKNYRMQSGTGALYRMDDLASRRRGRPPKYPRLDVPSVPKVELTETEIQESSKRMMDGETAAADEKVINGFRKFEVDEECPNDQCTYRSKVHYHCGRPRCHTATDRIDVLNLHAKDFHNFVRILDHFEFFDRNVSCRRSHCSNNGTNRHYHCTRPRCDYSFVRHSTMTQHDKKHTDGESQVSSSSSSSSTSLPTSPPGSTPLSPTGHRITPIQLLRRPDGQTYIPIVPAPGPGGTALVDKSSVVKASGTFYPLSGLPTMVSVSRAPITMVTSTGGGQVPLSSGLTLAIPPGGLAAGAGGIPVMASLATATATTANIVPVLAGNIISGTGASSNGSGQGPPLTVLLQQKPPGLNNSAGGRVTNSNGVIVGGVSVAGGVTSSQTSSWSTMRSSMHYSLQASCGRPFCKLKKKDHYHCLECNQAFSDPARLRGHISKHGVKFRKLAQQQAHAAAAGNAVSAAVLPPSYIPVAAVKGLPSGQLPLSSASATALVGLDLSSSAKLRSGVAGGKESRKADDEGEKDVIREEDGDDQDDDNDSLSSSLNLSIGKIATTSVMTRGGNGGYNFSSKSNDESSCSLVIDEEADYSDDDNESGSKVAAGESSRRGKKNEDGGNEEEAEDDNEDGRSVAASDDISASISAASSPTATVSSSSRRSGRKRSAPKHSNDFVLGDDTNLLAKQMKLKLSSPIPCTAPVAVPQAPATSAAPRNVPEGFIRFHCSSDCGYLRCSYRQSVTHFHCLRPECGYGFSDKSRILQHQFRHERIDKLMGDEFQQFRATVQCGRGLGEGGEGCEFSEKASHFHCQKCTFVCADSSKVLAHRKYHAKMDNIASNGFQKFGALQSCEAPMCAYSRKQTHYHCMHDGCNHAVLGPAQMAPHKLKHASHDV